MKSAGWIYFLADSREPWTQLYYGYTERTLNTRLAGHLGAAKAKKSDGSWRYTSHAMQGIRKVLRTGGRVVIRPVEHHFTFDALLAAEDPWIQSAKVAGLARWNTIPGGGANPMKVLAVREKCRATLLVSTTPEQRSEIARRAARAQVGTTSKQREARAKNARLMNARLTPEQRSENTRKRNSALTPQQRSESARKAGRIGALKANAVRWAGHVKVVRRRASSQMQLS